MYLLLLGLLNCIYGPHQTNMQTNWPVLLSMAVFYLVVLITGIWASRKSRTEEKKCTRNRSEVTMVGGRNLNVVVSIFTLTATWVGGGFILTSAEMVYSPKKGLVWALAPISSIFNLILGAIFFVKPIRSRNYVTLMDPFQNKYGNTVAAVIFIPALIADVMWAACILGILGLTVSMMVDIPPYLSIGISAAVAIVYTLVGGLYSVAYTDVIQLSFVFISLWFCVPFVVTNPATSNITYAALTSLYQEPWLGKLEPEDIGTWIDELLFLAVGGASYQAFYQRILSTATDAQAKITCYAGAAFCLILGIPPLIIGAAAASTNWNQTTYGSPSPFENGQSGMVLPIVLQHLVPFYVSLIGLGSITAAVMSSADSVLLSAASLLGRNIFKNIIFTQASEKRVILMVKLSILVCGLLAAGLAMATKSVHLLWLISTDVMYSMMVPQVICVFFLSQHVNEYGACFSCALALLLRSVIGEPMIGLPDLLPLPWDKTQEDGHRQRLFPFRTAIMLIAIVALLAVSRLALWLSDKGLLKRKLRDRKGDVDLVYMAPVSTDMEGMGPNK